MQLLQRRRRLYPELVDEHLARVLVRLERLRLPAAAVEREHELAARALAHRVLTHELLEPADELGRATELELRLHPLLDRRQPKLLEPGRLVLGERLIREVAERRTTPHLKRFVHEAGPAARLPPSAPRSRAARSGVRRPRPSLH